VQQVQKLWHLCPAQNQSAAGECLSVYNVEMLPMKVLDGKDDPSPDVVNENSFSAIPLQIPPQKMG
jgi:hypothetical protein